LTAGQTHEATVAASLLEHADGRAFIGDTGYDAERIRAAAAARGMRVVIPSHPTRATEHRLDKKLYRIRYRIECLFHRLKRCRRLATRYEKTGRNYLAFVHLACALIWISLP
jgi:transposase